MKNGLNTVWIVLVVLLTSMFCASAQEHGTNMPSGFTNIHIGMALKEFVKEHPNAQRFALFSANKTVDLGIPNQMLSETFKSHPLFEYSFYRFQEGHLETIVLVGKLKGAESKGAVERFKKMILATWGEPAEIHVIALDEDKGKSKAPAFVWKREDVVIAAAYTPEQKLHHAKTGTIQLKIQRVDSAETAFLSKVFVVPEISEEEEAALLRPARLCIKKWKRKNASSGAQSR